MINKMLPIVVKRWVQVPISIFLLIFFVVTIYMFAYKVFSLIDAIYEQGSFWDLTFKDNLLVLDVFMHCFLAMLILVFVVHAHLIKWRIDQIFKQKFSLRRAKAHAGRVGDDSLVRHFLQSYVQSYGGVQVPALVLKNDKLYTVQCSDAFLRLFDLDRSVINGSKAQDYLPEHIAELEMQGDEFVLHSKKSHTSFARLLDEDQEPRLIRIFKTPLLTAEENVHSIVTLYEEVSSTDQHAGQMYFNYRISDMLFEQPTVGIAICKIINNSFENFDFRYMDVNHRLNVIMDFAPISPGETMREHFPNIHEDHPALVRGIIEMDLTGKPFHYELWHPLLGNVLECHSMRIEPGMFILSVRDITETVHAERQLNRFKEGVARSLVEKNQRLVHLLEVTNEFIHTMVSRINSSLEHAREECCLSARVGDPPVLELPRPILSNIELSLHSFIRFANSSALHYKVQLVDTQVICERVRDFIDTNHPDIRLVCVNMPHMTLAESVMEFVFKELVSYAASLCEGLAKIAITIEAIEDFDDTFFRFSIAVEECHVKDPCDFVVADEEQGYDLLQQNPFVASARIAMLYHGGDLVVGELTKERQSFELIFGSPVMTEDDLP